MTKPWRVLPEPFLERLRTIIPKSQYEKVLSSFSIERPTTIRTNTLKITPEKLFETLVLLGAVLEKISWDENAYIIHSPELRTITEWEPYKQGLFYVQSLSSMIPALVLNPKPNETILDLCAAPGSKTTQIAAMMQNSGSLIASDNSRIRIYKLEANIKMQHVTNTNILFTSGQSIWQKYPEYFDKTLVDVPCSMEGRIKTNDPKSYIHWSSTKIKELAGRQKWLLRSAISATKPGGIIVYSTCTLAPEENEAIIDWILKKEKGSVSIEPITLSNYIFNEPILQWKGKKYHESIKNTARIFPSQLMEGFFIAKIQKHISTIPHHDVQLMS